jgi:hypothetical protein
VVAEATNIRATEIVALGHLQAYAVEDTAN